MSICQVVSLILTDQQGKRLKISEAESTLIATLLFVIGLADLLPVLESNNVYFKSMSRARLIIFSLIALVSFLQVVDILNGDLVFLLSVFEIAMNSLIIAEGN